MSGRNKIARVFVILGCLVLCLSVALHYLAYARVSPVLNASNLSPVLKPAFRVIFLSIAWHWLVIAVVVLLAAFTQTRLRKVLVLFCGLALLFEALAGAGIMGFFIGNEIICAAALLLICGGLLFDQTEIQAERKAYANSLSA